MANTVTSALEIEEAGVLLPAQGSHVVRVLGAFKRVIVHPAPPMKEDLTPLADVSLYERYYAGQLTPPPNPGAPPDARQVPDLFITAAGEPVFLERNLA